ncbi:hypothetical protein K504DRAFT_378786 [Pleomassaria siparia CBS 279.74]|uniref:Pre-rRNA processing protein n=1 Tax=Pleomassaria siparia CBS 279.74 TaxID=1314801 RepID=A0A6G1KA29_9PLEO|nr:hypothetical protein K504DRAFT_378786 [Pleomassaria siparia CBS 279.74]
MDPSEEPWASSTTPTSSSRPPSPKSQKSQRSVKSSRSARSGQSNRPTEQTPLLARTDSSDDEDEAEPQTSATSSLLQSLNGSTSGKTPLWKRRWPSILALVLLCIFVILIMFGFLASEGIEEYAKQASDFKPTKLSLDSLTQHGVKVQIEGDFTMDASKVQKKSVRNFGRFGTWIAHEAETGATDVQVYLPEYGNILVGTAKIPAIKVNIRNGHTTHISIFTDLEPGSFDGIRNIANDWIEGRLGHIRVKGKAQVPLKSGLIHLGSQYIEESLVFKGNDLPALPRYDITKLNLREAKDGIKGMGADVSIVVENDFPVQLTVPPVSVDVLVGGCQPSDQHIMVGTAETAQMNVEPKTNVEVNVTGHVESLPDSLTTTCPHSKKSPLDWLVGNYMQGEDATIYVNCCKFPDASTPDWARDLLKDITVPVPFAGRDMGSLIKNFTLADVHFNLPGFFAEPGTPEAAPRVSAMIKVVIALPKEMNFPIDVDNVLAKADVFYKKKKLGILDVPKQKANSTRVEAQGKDGPLLLVESYIKEAPLEITDDDLFTEVVSALLFGGKSIMLDIKAAVSVGVDTPIGKFVVREIPAEGVIPVKPNVTGPAIGHGNGDGGGDSIGKLSPKIGNLSIIGTSPTSITLQAYVNVTNPTNYSATVPYFNINILVNDTVLGQATAKDILVHPGNNTNIRVTAVWDPFTNSGAEGKAVGKELLSQYVSRYNTSLTLQTHAGTIPAQPALGSLLSKFPVTFQTPSLATPKKPSDDDPEGPDKPKDEGSHFIREATMHLISSTAIFTLASPFSTTTLYITHLNATAYHDSQPSGKILYDLPIAVPPGLSDTPRLPVDWSLGSVGYDAIKKALGGTLKLSAFADVGIRIGQWRQDIWFQGGAIGAHVRL